MPSAPVGHIAAWSAQHPTTRAINDDARLGPLGTTAAWVDTHLGIREVRLAGPDESLDVLGAAAVAEACRRAGITPADLDLIIGASSFDTHEMPAVAARVGARLGAPAFGYDVRAACSGFLVGLRTAIGHLASGEASQIVVCATEMTSLGIDPTDRLAIPIFGDAAAAVVVTNRPQTSALAVVDQAWRADHAEHGAVELPRAGWFRMDGPRTRRWVEKAIPDLAGEVLDRHGLVPEDLRALVCHQANLRLIERVATGLGVAEDRHWHNVEWAGNTSSAGAPSSLAAGLDANRADLRDGDLILIATVGSGLNVAVTLLRWTER